MGLWLWLNLAFGAFFALAIVGVPLWLVIARPDTQTAAAQVPTWRRAREHRWRQAAAARQAQYRPSRQPTAAHRNPAADNEPARSFAAPTQSM